MNFDNLLNYLLIALGIAALFFTFLIVTRVAGKENLKTKIENLLKKGDFKKALQAALLYAKDKEPDIFIYYYMGQCYEGLSQYHKAIDNFEKVLVKYGKGRASSFVIDINMKLGDLYFKINDEVGALAYYKAVLFSSNNPRALLHSAEINYNRRNYAAARDNIEQYIKVKPGAAKGRYLLAKIYYDLKQNQKALMQLNCLFQPGVDIISLFGFEAHHLLVDIYTQLKDYGGIINLLKGFLSKKEYADFVIPNAVVAYIKLGQVAEVEHVINNALMMLPVDKRTHVLYEAGSALFEAGEIYKAFDFWKQSCAMEPSSKAKEPLNRYRLLVNTPALENIFTNDGNRAVNFVLKKINMGLSNVSLDTREYIITKSENICFIVFKLPVMIYARRFKDLENFLKRKNLSNTAITLYSLFGVEDACRGSMFYTRMSIVTGESFVQFFNA